MPGGGGTCGYLNWYAADEWVECRVASGAPCIQKQLCGGAPCTPAYCWKPANAPQQPLAAPGDLAGDIMASNRIDLGWTDNSSNEAGLRVYRRIGGGAEQLVAGLGPNAESFSDSVTVTSSIHYYRVAAHQGSQEVSSPTIEVFSIQAPVMVSPSGCSPSTTPLLSWQAVHGATAYKLLITGYPTSSLPEEIIVYDLLSAGATSYTAPSLVPGRLHHWRVKALRGRQEVWASGVLYFTPGCTGAYVNDVTTTEGTGAPGNAVFTLTVSPPVQQQTTVWVTTADGTALGGQDFQPTAGYSLVIPAGQSTVAIPVAIVGDSLNENDETFFVRLTNPSAGLTLVDAEGVAYIANDDPLPALAVAGPSQPEGFAPGQAMFQVTLNAPSGRTVAVGYSTQNGSATSPGDYGFVGGSVEFAPGVTQRVVAVPVVGDDIGEADETFRVLLSNPLYATLATPEGTATLVNDDSPWRMVGTGRFNTDSKPDILWRRDGTGDLVGWLMGENGQAGTARTGGGFLTPPALADPAWKVVGTGNFNISDTKTDILWRNENTGELVVWLMNGLAMTSGGHTQPSGLSDLSWKVVLAADFNRDGQTDILWRHSVNGDFVVWFMAGVTLVRGVYLSHALADQTWEVVGSGDFNGDGWIDILFKHSGVWKLVSWIMGPPSHGSPDGIQLIEGLFVIDSNGNDMIAGATWQLGGTGDFDADGKVDVLWRVKSTGDSRPGGSNFVWLLGGLYTVPTGPNAGRRGILFREERNLDPSVLWN